MRELLGELDQEDGPEHPDTWLTHESGWTLSVFQSGLAIWSYDADHDAAATPDEEESEVWSEPRHQVGVSRERALDLWLKLSRGEIAAIEQEPWQPGHSPPMSAETRAQLVRDAVERRLASKRRFYETLGPERPDVPCSRAGCRRGAIHHSVECRVHHFESVCRESCPFSD
jgi:hypothetical protein